MEVLVGVTVALPLVDSEPDQAPLAVQLVALSLDQVSVDEAPALILEGLAVRVTVGFLGARAADAGPIEMRASAAK